MPLIGFCPCVCVRARGSGLVSVVPSYYPQSLRKNVSAENLQLNYLNKLGSFCVWDQPHECVLMEIFVWMGLLSGLSCRYLLDLWTKWIIWPWNAFDTLLPLLIVRYKSEFLLMQRFGRSLYVSHILRFRKHHPWRATKPQKSQRVRIQTGPAAWRRFLRVHLWSWWSNHLMRGNLITES